MELYLCLVPHGALAGPVKSGLAKEITRLHVEATGSPAELVHVVFQDLVVGGHFIAGKCDHRTSMMIAYFRAGRSAEAAAKLTKAISAAWSRLAAQPEHHLVITFNEAEGAVVSGFVAPEASGCESNFAPAK
jgi:phenylpyruvate tautomerase PptA (4-oxalocrotonate tautomerase family)